jgi:hypothetical protein
LDVTTTFMVRLFPAIAPTINLNPFTSPIIAPTVPLGFAFTGSATSPQAPVQLVQYKVENGQFANAVNVSGNWSQFRITLPLPPTAPGSDHTLTIRATDQFGTVGEISTPFAVQPQPPIVFPPGAKTTLAAATAHRLPAWGEDDTVGCADDIVDHELDAHRTAIDRGRHRHEFEGTGARPAVDADTPVADGRIPG